MSARRDDTGWLRRLPRRLSGSLVGGLLAALLIVAWESRGVDAPALTTALSLFGLLWAPLSVLTLLVACYAAWVDVAEPRGVGLLLTPRAAGEARERAALILVWGLGLPFLLLVLSAAVSRVFASEASLAGRGAFAALLVLLSCLGFMAVARAAGDSLAPRLPAGATPARSAAVAVVVCALGLFALVSLGEPSGGPEGASVLGVLRRPELDLRIGVYVSLTALLAFQGPVWFGRLHPALGIGLGIVLQLCVVFSSSSFSDASLRVGTEQGTALSRMALQRWQGFADGDGDGFAASFGGGDCNDADADVYPGAHDLPENGVDEDCSGSDSKKVAPPEPVVEPEPPPSDAPPADLNVLLLTVDTLRWDLGYTGYQRPISPNLDELAKRSVGYEKAYSLASYTGKSIGPMLIGRYPSETHRGWLHFNRYPRDKMVQERLQAAGVRTLSVQGHWYFGDGYGLERGFDVVDLSAAPRVPQAEGDRTVNSGQITDAALRLLDDPTNADERFFMWVHYLDPHSEYVPHPEFDFGSGSRALYDGEIAFTDHHIGRLLDGLATRGLDDQTAIIFTSDHGEAFGEHGMIRHGFEVWEEIVRVPLLVHVPEMPTGRVKLRRSAIDLVPTLLELFDLPRPVGDDFVRGHSWLADVRAPSEAKARPVLVDMPAGPYNGERQAYIENDFKITTSNTRTMGVFNLAEDPGERNNLMKDAELAKRLHANYLEFRRQLEPVRVKPR